MSRTPRSGGEVLIDGLIGFGATRLFCVPGESYLAALDALHDRSDKLDVITCRQEGGASYMAEAHGKLTGKPGICFVSRGPGASNAMIGIHTAFQDSTPMLLFIGQVSRSDIGREAFQELNFREVFGAVAKKVIRIDDARRIPELLAQAWNTATSGRPGPVVVELPEDMLTDMVTVEDALPTDIPLPAPNPKSMTQLATLLGEADNPVLIVGGAGWTPGATAALQTFVDNQNLPVATSFRRSDSFDNTHPNYIGELGLAPNPKLVERIKQADLLIAVGPRIGDMTTAGYTTLEVPDRKSCLSGQKLVHVHISADEINTVFRSDLGIVSQPENFFIEACKMAKCTKDHTATITKANRIYLDFLTEPRFENAAMRMDRVSEFLRGRLPGNSIITVGAGNFSVWGQRHYQFRQPRTQLGSTNGSMGYGVPSAIAAKLAHPESLVVSFSGDGCFMMNGQELATAVQHGANVVFLVVNNGCYGTIRTHQERHYPGRPSATRLENPDFAALARAYGAFGAVVRQTAEFEKIFEQAVSSNKPALIEIQTDD
jgi:acetolactate synthase-1/2/3 large subunit